VLVDFVYTRLNEIIHEVMTEFGCEIFQLEIMPDQGH